jgi:PAS domain S-box-containing protein
VWTVAPVASPGPPADLRRPPRGAPVAVVRGQHDESDVPPCGWLTPRALKLGVDFVPTTNDNRALAELGEATGDVSLIRDLRAPVSSEARERSFLEAALDCILIADEYGRVVEFNPSAERVFGYPRDKALGRRLSELIIPPARRASHESAFARFAQTRQKRLFGQRIEMTAMRSDGSEFPVELVLSQIEGEPLLVCGAVRDLTDAKRAEEDLRRLADEQHLLRRIATLVARGSDLDEVVDTVCRETGRMVGAAEVRVVQHRADGLDLKLAEWNRDGAPFSRRAWSRPSPDGARYLADTDAGSVRQSGALPRRDVVEPTNAPSDGHEVMALILVDGVTWGSISVAADHPLPVTTAESVASLAELTAISVANAKARSELIASRARTIAAADEARRRLQRDIHDGAQQRLVTSLIHLQLAEERIESDPSAAHRGLRAAMESAKQGLDDLRDLAAGLHPTILTTGGLGAALDGLAARSALPVTVEAPDARYPSEIEAAVYFLVAEALTNVGKHAHASRAEVQVVGHSTALVVIVRDDGVGGARLEVGSGLRGLDDRVAALGGSFTVDSARDQGTVVRAVLPLPGAPAA